MLSILFWIAAVIVGYCLICWIIGFTLAYLGKIHHDLIIQSTFFAPFMPIALVSVVIEDEVIFKGKDWLRQRKARWLASELQKCGITLKQIKNEFPYYSNYSYLHRSCEVVADLKSEDIKTYQVAYARAKKNRGGGALRAISANPHFHSILSTVNGRNKMVLMNTSQNDLSRA